MSEDSAVIIVDLIESKKLLKFSSFDEVNEFTATLEIGTLIKIYVPDKIHTMVVK